MVFEDLKHRLFTCLAWSHYRPLPSHLNFHVRRSFAVETYVCMANEYIIESCFISKYLDSNQKHLLICKDIFYV